MIDQERRLHTVVAQKRSKARFLARFSLSRGNLSHSTHTCAHPGYSSRDRWYNRGSPRVESSSSCTVGEPWQFRGSNKLFMAAPCTPLAPSSPSPAAPLLAHFYARRTMPAMLLLLERNISSGVSVLAHRYSLLPLEKGRLWRKRASKLAKAGRRATGGRGCGGVPQGSNLRCEQRAKWLFTSILSPISEPCCRDRFHAPTSRRGA